MPTPTLLTVLITPIILLTTYLISLISHAYSTRRKYTLIPSLPRHPLLGNLIQAGTYLSPSNPRHPDYGFEKIWQILNQPSAFLLDLSPIDRSFLIVADPTLAETFTRPSPRFKYSLPKSSTTEALQRLTGKQSMLTAEGEAWRNLRRRFNRGFSPAYLHTLAPLVVGKTRGFVDRLRREGKTVEMKGLAQDLTTDIITTIAVECDFGSQGVEEGRGEKGPMGFLTACRMLPGTVGKVGQGIDWFRYVDLGRVLRGWWYERIQNSRLEMLIWEGIRRENKGRARAIVQLSLEGLEPTKDLIVSTRDQIKTFLFAGQDTTATAIQWICWELAQARYEERHAGFLTRLREEHDAVFGKGVDVPFDVLENAEEAERILGDKLPYTTAFIKEILRVHPPAGSARMLYDLKEGETPFMVDIDGKMVEVDGLRVYLAHWLIHRNPKVWGEDATEFNPDRWMDEEYVRNLPAGAWRPFERGPRDCIGQELAMMELKVVLCAIARGFEFEKIGNTGRNGEQAVYNKHEVTSVPSDGMVMKIHLRNGN